MAIGRIVKFTANDGTVSLAIVTSEEAEGGEGSGPVTLVWRVPDGDRAAVPAGSDASSADGTFEEIG